MERRDLGQGGFELGIKVDVKLGGIVKKEFAKGKAFMVRKDRLLVRYSGMGKGCLTLLMHIHTGYHLKIDLLPAIDYCYPFRPKAWKRPSKNAIPTTQAYPHITSQRSRPLLHLDQSPPQFPFLLPALSFPNAFLQPFKTLHSSHM